MNATSRFTQFSKFLIVASLFAALTAGAQSPQTEELSGGARTAAWLALPSWPSLKDLQPAAGGSFKAIGYGLGASVHWPLRQLRSGELMLGVEGAIMATDSDVPVLLDDLLARGGYLAISTKWFVGDSRKFSLDAGLSYHLLDIAQLESDYNSSVEFESWEESAAGLFIGSTWDTRGGGPGRNGGLSLGLKIHFLDFGIVRDEELFITPVLGSNAGDLDGPMYVFEVGYSWR